MQLYGISAPESACKVRLATKLGRVGRSPIIRCDEVDENAVQDAIDESPALRKHFRSLEHKDRQKLGPKPWPIKADLTFLGSDGKDIDPAQEVELSYYGPDKDEQAESSPQALHDRAMDVVKTIVEAAQKSAEASSKGVAEVAKAHAEGHKANADALAKLAAQQQVLATMNEKLLAETQELKEAVVGLTREAAAGGKTKTAPKTLGEEIKEGISTVESLKSLSNTLFGESEPEKPKT